MSEQKAHESIEVERKYDVAWGAEVPADFDSAGLRVAERVEHRMVARYFDTRDGALGKQRVAVRVREGGADAGWHLKEKNELGARELAWPPAPEMPAGLVDEIRTRIGDAVGSVQVIAEIATTRLAIRLVNELGEDRIELADDRVVARDERAGVSRAWREWEAESIAPEGAGVGVTALDALEPVLLAAGAVVSPSFAKIARATGQLAAIAEHKGAPTDLVTKLSAMDQADQDAARRLGA
ncbi:CYTH domain-containing protein [Leucobacter sp. 1207-22]|uniref:CYTH domain-containing protein n=1 Tax=Leucobacter sp. 1207-22 TaxID=2604456 RepID=UPI00406460BF